LSFERGRRDPSKDTADPTSNSASPSVLDFASTLLWLDSRPQSYSSLLEVIETLLYLSLFGLKALFDVFSSDL
jgi:hypothetical protein